MASNPLLDLNKVDEVFLKVPDFALARANFTVLKYIVCHSHKYFSHIYRYDYHYVTIKLFVNEYRCNAVLFNYNHIKVCPIFVHFSYSNRQTQVNHKLEYIFGRQIIYQHSFYNRNTFFLVNKLYKKIILVDHRTSL